MMAVSAMILILSCQGHWFGGGSGTVTITFAAKAAYPPATLQWTLLHDSIALSNGEVALLPQDKPSTLTLDVPPVRALTRMTFSYRLLRQDNGLQLAAGQREVVVYPDDLLDASLRRAEHDLLLIAPAEDPLVGLLERKHSRHVRLEDPPALADRKLILVSPRQPRLSGFQQDNLLKLAASGASIIVMQQEKQGRLMGYDLAARPAPREFEWRMDHPLLRAFERRYLSEWIASGTEMTAVRLPVGEPALEIVYWPAEIPADTSAPIDALVVSKTVGAGRLVLCQLPLGDWQNDPRQQLFLANALDYLSTRSAQTPPPDRRPGISPTKQPPAKSASGSPGGEE